MYICSESLTMKLPESIDICEPTSEAATLNNRVGVKKNRRRAKKPIVCGVYKFTAKNGKYYIGQSNDIHERWGNYKKSGAPSQPKFHNALMAYGFDTFKREILQVCGEAELNDLEKYYEDLFWCPELRLNLRECGGSRGKWHEESRAKLSNTNKGNKNSLGTKRTEEQKRLASINHPTKVSVARYNIDTGDLIDTFDSYTAATKGINAPGMEGTIYDCCNGVQKTAYGCIWRNYEESPILKLTEEEVVYCKTKKIRPDTHVVDLFDKKTGVFIRQIIDAEKAKKEFGYNGNPAYEVCRGEKKTYKGFICRFGVKGVIPQGLLKEEVAKAVPLKCVHTEESKNKIREKLMGNTHGAGHVVTEYAKERTRQANTGNTYNLGKKYSEERKINMQENHVANITVARYDKETGIFIDLWRSSKQIKRALGFEDAAIRKCCGGGLKSAYGYIWRFVQKGEQPLLQLPLDVVARTNTVDLTNVAVRVIEYDALTGKFKRIWNCMSDIKRESGYGDGSNITAVCKGRQNTAYGSIWRYYTEDYTLQLSVEDIMKSLPKRGKPINQKTLQGEFVKRWDNARQASEALGYCAASISRACNGKSYQQYNFRWEFANE